MAERENGPVRRRRALRPEVRLEAHVETPESILPGSPRVGALDALLREVDGLRMTLETDLTLAASAVEAGHPGLAADILDSDRSSLGRFEQRALGHLAELAEPPSPLAVARRRRRVPAAPFVAAAAVVGFVLGLAPQLDRPAPETTSTTLAASSSLDLLQAAAADGDTNAVRATSATLHQQLLAAVADAGSDPAAAQRALLLLSYERDAIVSSGGGAALRDVLMKSTALANRIRAALPATLRSGVPVAPAIVAPSSPPRSSSSPKPKPTPSASPSASPAAKPTASPSPSASPSQDSLVPTGSPVDGG